MQTCSIETNCDAGSLMAATLANGGICPLTGQKVIKQEGNSIIIIIIIIIIISNQNNLLKTSQLIFNSYSSRTRRI